MIVCLQDKVWKNKFIKVGMKARIRCSEVYYKKYSYNEARNFKNNFLKQQKRE